MGNRNNNPLPVVTQLVSYRAETVEQVFQTPGPAEPFILRSPHRGSYTAFRLVCPIGRTL